MFNVVGLGDKVVGESCEWVCGVIVGMGLLLLFKCIVVNLLLVDLFKEGLYFDLFIVFVLLGVMGVVDVEMLVEYVIVGEFGFDVWIIVLLGVLFVVLYVLEVGKGLICLVV